jgi:hypothetical protein
VNGGEECGDRVVHAGGQSQRQRKSARSMAKRSFRTGSRFN